MKKLLSLVLALAMFLTVVPAFAENTDTADAGGKFGAMLSSLFGSEAGTEGQEAGGLGSLLGGLFSSEGEGGFDLSALIEPLIQKLSTLKGIKVSDITAALKDKIGGLKDKISGLLGGGTRSADGEGSMGGLTGLLDNIFGGEVSSESGFDISGLLGGLLGSSDNAEGDLSTLLGLLGGGSTGTGVDGVSEDDLNSLLGQLFSSESESGSEEEFDLESFLEAYRNTDEYREYLARREALKVHLAEEFGLEPADEQILTYSEVMNFYNEDPNFTFGYFALGNYTAEGNALKLKNYGGNMELVTFAKQEDGTFKVAKAETVEEGENNAASIEKLCKAYGVTYEDYVEHIDFIYWDEIEDILDFIRNNPQYEQVEYQGTLRTADELQAIQEKIINDIMASMEAAEAAE